MAAHLHHELIAHGDPARWLLLTHGMFGAGHNWRGIARKLVERRSDWGVVLVDLRQHGRSEAGEAPNDLAACANDLRVLITELGELGKPVAALAGHSFGGKVVLAARALVAVRQTWLLDASPSRTPGDTTVTRVLELMETLPKTWTRRDEFVAALVAGGQTSQLAQWLAINVVYDAGAYRLRLDLPAIREMLADYQTRDMWDEVLAPSGGDVEIVVADRSPVFTADDRARLANLPPHVHVHHVDAGHWLHIDAPAAVIELFAKHLVTDSQLPTH